MYFYNSNFNQINNRKTYRLRRSRIPKKKYNPKNPGSDKYAILRTYPVPGCVPPISSFVHNSQLSHTCPILAPYRSRTWLVYHINKLPVSLFVSRSKSAINGQIGQLTLKSNNSFRNWPLK